MAHRHERSLNAFGQAGIVESRTGFIDRLPEIVENGGLVSNFGEPDLLFVRSRDMQTRNEGPSHGERRHALDLRVPEQLAVGLQDRPAKKAPLPARAVRRDPEAHTICRHEQGRLRR